MNRIASLLPGLAVAAAATAVAWPISMLLPVLSPLLVAIVLGILLGNLVPNLPETFMPGLNFAAKPLLRLGIVALGAQVVLGDILDLGWLVLVLAAVIVAAGILSALALAKPLKVDRPLAVLIGSGFGICGAAAVAGIESTLKSKKEDVAAAIGLVVLFGTLMIAIVPSLSTAMGLSPETAGMWGGAATHEVAQVVAIGGIIGPAALEIAVLVKLARVIMLAPTVAVFSYAVRRSEAKAMTTGTEAAPDRVRPPRQVPARDRPTAVRVRARRRPPRRRLRRRPSVRRSCRSSLSASSSWRPCAPSACCPNSRSPVSTGCRRCVWPWQCSPSAVESSGVR